MTTETLSKEDQEFEAGFADAAKAISTETAPAPAPAVADAAPVPAPAPAAAAPVPAPAADAPAPAPAAPAPVTLESLQEELRLSALRERGSAERASFNARQSNELARQVRELNEKVGKLSAAPAVAPAPPPVVVADEDDVLTNAPDLERAVTKRLEKLIAPVRDKLTAAETRIEAEARSTAEALEPIGRQTHKTTVEDTFNELDKGFTPAWRDTVKAPEFQEWLAARPQRTQDLYANSIGADDCAEVLDLFYASRGGRPKATAAPAPAPAPAVPGGGTDPNERLRLAAGVPPGRSSTRPVPIAADDFDGAFAAANAAIQAEKAGQRART